MWQGPGWPGLSYSALLQDSHSPFTSLCASPQNLGQRQHHPLPLRQPGVTPCPTCLNATAPRGLSADSRAHPQPPLLLLPLTSPVNPATPHQLQLASRSFP